jgi:hypothetical protein
MNLHRSIHVTRLVCIVDALAADSGGQFLTGRLSDFRIYNRALGPTEIHALYLHELAVLGAKKVDQTLVLSWHRLLTPAGLRRPDFRLTPFYRFS